MLQTRVTFTQPEQISFFSVGLWRRLPELRSNAVLLAAGTLAGQFAVAYGALSPSAAAEPDGGSTMRLLLPYSAVILGFLSSYWGLWQPEQRDDGAPYSPRRAALAERRRLIASLLPTVMGGAAMLLPMFLPATAGLLALIAGFLVLFGLETGGRHRGMPLAGYPGLRWTIGGVAIAILCNVATVRLWDYSLFF